MKLLAFLSLCTLLLSAQDALTLNRLIAPEIELGTTNTYSITLNAGDYVAAVIDQQSVRLASAIAYSPSGDKLREFPMPPSGKRQVSFIAEKSGLHRLEIKLADNSPSGKYELKLVEKLALDERLKPVLRADKYLSPRIEALRREIESGQRGTDGFWRHVEAEGTPIAESYGTDGKYQLVTLLWRGDAGTRNVLVTSSLNPPSYLDPQMSHLPGSDVWYLTLKLPTGARFFYRFSINDPLVVDGPRAAVRDATRQADPFNVKRFRYREGMNKYDYNSVAELPGAAPQPWIVKKPGTPEGTITKHQIKSDIQKLERGISVYTPPGYRTGGPPYPLVVLFDESAYLEDPVPTPTILNNLIAASKIPPAVAVLVSNMGIRRTQDLSPNQDFADFLAKELIPWMRAHYNVTKDPAQTVVGGSSLGGLASAYMGLRFPDVFGNILSQSGSYWWAPDHNYEGGQVADVTTEPNWMAKQFIAGPKLPLKFYLDAGVFEADMSGSGGGILEPTRHLRDVLLAKGYEVHYQQFVGGHDYLSWRGTLADGLMYLIGTK